MDLISIYNDFKQLVAYVFTHECVFLFQYIFQEDRDPSEYTLVNEWIIEPPYEISNNLTFWHV